ncbi:PEGA domain-containing protein, partial [bacterium]|nr:PEGA domain-containing protein [bacterium]
ECKVTCGANPAFYVESNPVGAEVVVDGKATGIMTPAVVVTTDKKAKKIDVELKKDGFADLQTELKVKGVEQKTVNLSMKANTM